MRRLLVALLLAAQLPAGAFAAVPARVEITYAVFLGSMRIGEGRDVFQHDKGALGRFKKIAKYFTHGVPYGSVLREGVLHAHTADQAIDIVHDFFDRLRRFQAGIEPHPFIGSPEESAA